VYDAPPPATVVVVVEDDVVVTPATVVVVVDVVVLVDVTVELTVEVGGGADPPPPPPPPPPPHAIIATTSVVTSITMRSLFIERIIQSSNFMRTKYSHAVAPTRRAGLLVPLDEFRSAKREDCLSPEVQEGPLGARRKDP
jgi:hypothetical protein